VHYRQPPGTHADGARADPTGHRNQVTGPPDDRDVTVLIGPQQRHAEPGHLAQQQR
jgi:hypothetical protein